jgi:hypothetical protein
MERIIDRHGLSGCATRIPVSLHAASHCTCNRMHGAYRLDRAACVGRACIYGSLCMQGSLCMHGCSLRLMLGMITMQLIIHDLGRCATLYHCEWKTR